jgi:catechol 2,3-dioxygenase-like lactoylglutathione lyase family enzyme
MRTLIGLFIGTLFGIALTLSSMPVSAQDARISGIRGVNHVGLSVDNFEESVAFYTQKLGFPEAYRFKNEQGQTTIAFVQAGPNTFLEIAPSNANRPAGLTHFGVQVDNMEAAIAALKDRGVMATAPREVAPQWSVSSVTGPGARVELTALGSDSVLEKATAGWRR